jgi:membrane protein involved in colicin uptake
VFSWLLAGLFTHRAYRRAGVTFWQRRPQKSGRHSLHPQEDLRRASSDERRRAEAAARQLKAEVAALAERVGAGERALAPAARQQAAEAAADALRRQVADQVWRLLQRGGAQKGGGARRSQDSNGRPRRFPA